MNWSNSRRTKESEVNHWSQSYLPVRPFCFLMFGMSSFWYVKNCIRSHILHASCKQNIGNLNSEANACIGIYIWSSSVPFLNHNASKNVRLVTLWYEDITATSLAKQWWFCSDGCYHKGIWYTQTFSSQLLRGCNKNLFTSLACYKICCAVEICQIIGSKGG